MYAPMSRQLYIVIIYRQYQVILAQSEARTELDLCRQKICPWRRGCHLGDRHAMAMAAQPRSALLLLLVALRLMPSAFNNIWDEAQCRAAATYLGKTFALVGNWNSGSAGCEGEANGSRV